MGETIAEISITGPKGSKTVHAVVDTGATNTVVPKELADSLGIVTTRADEVVLADGSTDKVGVGSAEVEIQGIRQVVPVYIYKGTVIGLTTLEAAGFRVNPVTQTLEKVPGKLLRVVRHETRVSCGGSGRTHQTSWASPSYAWKSNSHRVPMTVVSRSCMRSGTATCFTNLSFSNIEGSSTSSPRNSLYFLTRFSSSCLMNGVGV